MPENYAQALGRKKQFVKILEAFKGGYANDFSYLRHETSSNVLIQFFRHKKLGLPMNSEQATLIHQWTQCTND
eukprot:snap_masked-scaffold_1-processed-gene-5.10-mRNA-1 protein AED:1.00 eAED:1.00 QI:0/-1/0/0/-1/1/1/0/72